MDVPRPSGPSAILVSALFVAGLLIADALAVPPALARWMALVALSIPRLLNVDWRRPFGACAAGALVLLAAVSRGASAGGGTPEPTRPPEVAGTALLELRAVAVETPVIRDAVEAPDRPRSGRGATPRSLFRARVLDGRGRSNASIRVLVLDDVRWIRPGDMIRMRGRLLPVRWPRLPGMRRPSGLVPTIAVPSARLLSRTRATAFAESRDPGFSIVDRVVWACRGATHEIISSMYSDEHRGAMLALVLGDRRELDEDLRDDLQHIGAAHYLAISGLHAGLVLAMLLRVPLPRPARLALRLGLLAVFALVTGAKPPVVRAVLMLALALSASETSRVARPLDALAWTILLVLAWEPAWLRELGFQLSALAVLGILVWSPRFEALLTPSSVWTPPAASSRRRSTPMIALAIAVGRGLGSALRKSLAVSLAAGLVTAPLVLLTFQRIHPLSPLWNVALYPAVALGLVAGCISVLLGLVSTTLAMPAIWIAERGLDATRELASAFRDVPGSCIDLPAPPVTIVVACTALLLCPIPRVAVSTTVRSTARATTVAATLTLIVLLANALHARRLPRGVEIWSFDVGAGSSHLVLAPDGSAVLIDVGSRDRVRFAGKNVAAALLALGVTRLDAIILTHKDADHVNGLEAVLARVDVGAVWVSPLFDRFEHGPRVLASLAARGVPVGRLHPGDRLVARDREDATRWALRVVQPVPSDDLPYLGAANESSLVLMLEVTAANGTYRALLPADIEIQGVARLLSRERELDVDVLVLPHHGAKNGLIDELIARTTPRLAVISASETPSAVETRTRLLRRVERVDATWVDGTSRVSLPSSK